MFHLRFPRTRGFFTWDELGCLSRALGYPTDLFPANMTDEITCEENGLHKEEIARVLDYRLLHETVHLTYNLHTDNWNVSLIRKAVTLLDHKAFSFERLHSIRVAFQLYEHLDMKGMLLDKHILLRTLKMCNRTIAPMKLMHRVKHMRVSFEERGRIQLYEFLDLILWCDLYEEFNPYEMENAEGKEKELFRLVDFDRLLSHHDARLGNRLNAEYLREEWDFGLETFGCKKLSKEPPVKTEARIEQVSQHTEHYQPLKSEVSRSQARVYRAHAGFVRRRPLTAPNLLQYQPHPPTPQPEHPTAQRLYERLQHTLKSSNVSRQEMKVEAPRLTEHHWEPATALVSGQDLIVTETKLEDLKFQMETLAGRYQFRKELDLKTLIPNYKPSTKDDIALPQPIPVCKTKAEQKSREEVLNSLVYPKPLPLVAHSRSCDAKLRGWHAVKTRSGSHYILASPSFDNSSNGRLMEKLYRKSAHQIRSVHRDCLFRSTDQDEERPGMRGPCPRRPVTAPGRTSVSHGYTDKTSTTVVLAWQGGISANKTVNNGINCMNRTPTDDDTVTSGTAEAYMSTGKGKDSSVYNTSINGTIGTKDIQSVNSCSYGRLHSTSEPTVHSKSGECETSRYWSTSDTKQQEIQRSPPSTTGFPKSRSSPAQSKTNAVSRTAPCSVEIPLPVPHMEHSKAKVVAVGQIGRIRLLEDIVESRDLEETEVKGEPEVRVDGDRSDGDKGEQSLRSVKDNQSLDEKGGQSCDLNNKQSHERELGNQSHQDDNGGTIQQCREGDNQLHHDRAVDESREDKPLSHGKDDQAQGQKSDCDQSDFNYAAVDNDVEAQRLRAIAKLRIYTHRFKGLHNHRLSRTRRRSSAVKNPTEIIEDNSEEMSKDCTTVPEDDHVPEVALAVSQQSNVTDKSSSTPMDENMSTPGDQVKKSNYRRLTRRVKNIISYDLRRRMLLGVA